MAKFNFIFLLFILLLLWGCEKIIDVDLNETNPVIVIESELSDKPNSTFVKISKTTSYFSTEPAETVTGAAVKITDDEGREFDFNENNGVYISNIILQNFGKKFTLSVDINGTVYESVSTLHRPVLIDSLSSVLNEAYSTFQDGYNVNLFFHDPPGENNYYRLKIFLNNTLEINPEDFILFDDNNTNGKFLELRIKNIIFRKGDNVTYELQSLDKTAYEYLEAVSELINNNSIGTAAPANPDPNFTNGALGYFSAYSSDKKTIVVH